MVLQHNVGVHDTVRSYVILIFFVVPVVRFLWKTFLLLLRGLRNAFLVVSGNKETECTEPVQFEECTAETRRSSLRRKNRSASAAAATTTTTCTLLIDQYGYQLYLLRAIVTASTSAMRKIGTENVFLRPVTNEIAPGYSEVISEPMCILTTCIRES